MSEHKKIAIMQPYFMPYIGYWQLINAVDEFVLLDDVNFIKRGFINRNRILINGNEYLFSIPIKNASQNQLICDTKLSFSKKEKEKFLKMLHMAYKKAPYYDEVMPLMEEVLLCAYDDTTEYIQHSLQCVLEYLKCTTKITKSSAIVKPDEVRADDRIIYICKEKSATQYINPCGGKALYDKDKFHKNGIRLNFLNADVENIKYEQLSKEFIGSLSIIDILFMNSVDSINIFLERYYLE